METGQAKSIRINPGHDITFDIATGRHRREMSWKNKEIAWSELVNKVSVTFRTNETMAEYAAASKVRQDEIKDIGGFVAGYITGGRRKAANILHRQAITLDVDFAKKDFWEVFCKRFPDCAAFVYSTHKHKPDSPRLRLVVLLDRCVTTDEYVPLARRIAGDIEINDFDDTTFEHERLMYWPSTSKDGEYFFEYQDAPPLCANDILATYRNWQDSSEWPFSDRVGETIHRDIKKQGDPTEKKGYIGYFCREYDIHEAIETFLPGVYTACDVEDRYTYAAGSTGAGLVVYDDKYTYSHHSTDPTSGMLCNAFDLVRIHLFGLKDADAKAGTPITSMPSYNAMQDFARQDSRVLKRMGSERLEALTGDFAQPLEEGGEAPDRDWLTLMDADRKGNYRNTIDNAFVALSNDPSLKGKIAFNEFDQREMARGDLPWRKVTPQTQYLTDKDDSGIRSYLEKVYSFSGVQKIQDALNQILLKNTFHPVRDYLSSLTWDGVNRLDTLLIDYLGAEDTPYTRAVTRKTLVAAVARVFNPGCKFDYVLVLIGDQGIGKSTIVNALGRDWYSDSFTGVEGKDAFDQIQGVWILELAELAGLKKGERDAIKHFISKGNDRYRVAYGKRTEDFPRQCIFIGTTNTRDFLSDPSGDRRFWPIDTMLTTPTKDFKAFKNNPYEVSRVWAEAVTLYKAGEPLYLHPELEAVAKAMQTEHREIDDRTGQILHFLDTLLPVDWDYADVNQRRLYLAGDELSQNGTITRNRVCIAEIWCELFRKDPSDMDKYKTRELHSIMKTVEGWKASPNPVNVKPYGKQRVYSRINTGNNAGNNAGNNDHQTGNNSLLGLLNAASIDPAENDDF